MFDIPTYTPLVVLVAMGLIIHTLTVNNNNSTTTEKKKTRGRKKKS